MQQEDSPSRISNLKWDDHLPELRDNLALVRCDPFVVYSETVHWYEDEVDEEGDSVEEGLVRVS